MGGNFDDSVDGRDTENVAIRIVSRVAEEEGVDPMDLPPIYGVIDTEALEKLTREPSVVGPIRFGYNGWTVEVESGGNVSLTDRSIPSD